MTPEVGCHDANSAPHSPSEREYPRRTIFGDMFALAMEVTFSPWEFTVLLQSRVYRETNPQRGSGKPVVTLPGFMGSDSSLRYVNNWLTRYGFTAVSPPISSNSGDIEAIMKHEEATIEKAAEEADSRVIIVAHSMGGLQALHLMRKRPDLVEQVITLGTPFVTGEWSVNQIATGFGRGLITSNPERLAEKLFSDEPLPGKTELYCISAKFDGVANPAGCCHPQALACIRVESSHMGLVFSKSAFEALDQILPGRHNPSAAPLKKTA